MPNDTPNLKLPYLIAAQAQKHVTHNEAIRNLDAIVQLSALDRSLVSAPASPANGDRYIVAPAATGDWLAKDGQIAAFQDNVWSFYPPQVGWLCWVANELKLLAFDGTTWNVISSSISGGLTNTLNTSTRSATTVFELREEELILSGPSTDSTILIPDRAIVFAITTRTTQAITGAASYDCGIAGDISKYGGALGAAAGSTNSGVTGPTAFYADTPVRLTANGADFTGGKVRLTLHFMLCTIPTS
ncbi:MAG: DUF2793 domain-containing protein, partial [Hyphomicrobiaceae bacterium]|nr:DUF2793 domain-containing protein [Hyphomicrobiaceae bacterium]